MTDVRILSSKSDECSHIWDAYIHNNNIPPLAIWGSGDILDCFYKKRVLRILAFDAEKKVCGYFLGYSETHNGAQLYGVQFGFHAQNLEIARSIYEKIKEYCKTRRVSQILISYGLETYDGLMVVSKKTNIFLPLQKDENALWGCVPTKTRNIIRKGKREGYSVANSWKYFDEFYEVYQNRFHQKGLTMKPKGLFRALKDVYADDLNLWVALDELGKVEAGMIFLKGRRVASYLYNASTQKAARAGANNLIIWEVMKYFAKRDIEYIELAEATEGGGVYNFKKQLHKDSRILPIMYGNSMEEKKIQAVKVSFLYYFLVLGLKFYHFLPSKPIQMFFLKRGSQYGRVM